MSRSQPRFINSASLCKLSIAFLKIEISIKNFFKSVLFVLIEILCKVSVVLLSTKKLFKKRPFCFDQNNMGNSHK